MNTALTDATPVRRTTAAITTPQPGPRVKMRPDVHYSRIPQGVYWVRPGGRAFVLAGPPALFQLIDARLDLLTAGTTVDDLVASVSDEAARPVYAHIVRTLLEQDMLFDLGTAGPVPDEQTAAAYADVLGYLECNCARPYQAFALLRAAQIAVHGAGPAVTSLITGLASYGVSAWPASRPDCPSRPDLTVLVDDADHPLDLPAAARRLSGASPVLPVQAGERCAVVGASCRDTGGVTAFAALATRVAQWVQAGEAAPAPRPVSATLAGSVAAKAVADLLLGLGGGADATVVHGAVLECSRIPASPPPPASCWQDLAGVVADAQEPADADPGTGTGTSTEGEGSTAESGQLGTQAGWLTRRWTGLARWGADLDLPQLPLALATVTDISAPGPAAPAIAGWGTDRVQAGLDALLSLLRGLAARQVPAEPGWVAAAGSSMARLAIDGLLQITARDWLPRTPGREISSAEADSRVGRSLWHLLADYYAIPVQLRLQQVPGLSWPLVTVTGGTGGVLASQWGPTKDAAIRAALAAAVAASQLAEDEASTAILRPAGTWLLNRATKAQLGKCQAELAALADAAGLRVTGRLLTSDPVGGEPAMLTGLIGLR